MDPELLTALVRAGNDGVIPAPLAGEDMRTYKFRAACAGAIVAAQWMEKHMADKAEKIAQDVIEHGDTTQNLARPGDVTMTTSTVAPDGQSLHPARTAEEIDQILRRPSLNGAGTRTEDSIVEIGVD